MQIENRSVNELLAEQLLSTAAFFDGATEPFKAPEESYRAQLISILNNIIPKNASVLEVGCHSGELLARLNGKKKRGIDLSSVQIARAAQRYPSIEFSTGSGELFREDGTFDYVVAADTLNLAADVQLFLENLQHVSTDQTRLVVTVYNTLWRPILSLATACGLRRKLPKLNWLSQGDVENLLELAGWELIKCQHRVLLPIEIPLISKWVNRWVAPFLPALCLCLVFVARKTSVSQPAKLSVSVVVPARNEAGNIRAAVERVPEMGAWTEIIFVEGGSRDSTWEEIQKLPQSFPDRKIRVMRQSGKGKGDAVRMGFGAAEGDLLMILDADLTMPPEELGKYYQAVAAGHCDFANGCRLVYPMEEKAMQFLNLCANKFFGIAFSWLLGQQVKDTLCGTKVLTRSNYLQIAANRAYFGDFDPFGDFDLLFGADRLNLKIRDIPIRYKDRTYGSTNIQRWKHGMILIRMMLFAARKLKFT